MIINHNLPAINAHRNMGIANLNGDRDLSALSSGLRINKAADDAAGLAVSEKMRSQIRGLNQASRNAQDTISFIQTAEGWLTETTSAIQRVRELSVQAANGIYTNEDRQYINKEIAQLVDEVQRISDQAEFNTWLPLNGTFSSPTATPPTDGEGGLIAHVGANANQNTRVFIGNMSAVALGLKDDANNLKVTVSSVVQANQAIIASSEALNRVNELRANLGAYQNRMEMAIQGINIAAENMQAAESRIRDTDMAMSMVDFVKNSILTQSSTSMLAQANLRPQLVLRVLG